MKKTALRKKYKALRQGLSEEELETKSIDIANKLLKLPIWEYRFYHIYLPIIKQKEINTEYILSILQGKDKHIVVSKSDFKTNTLSHYLLSDNTVLKTNIYGIPEPVNGIKIQEEQLDVIFVPLLAFNKHGHRVGYGKGFYDRFLNSCKSSLITIGLSFFEAENIIEDLNNTDVILDYVVTPKMVYKIKKPG